MIEPSDATLADIKANAAKIHARIEANIAAARKRLAGAMSDASPQ